MTTSQSKVLLAICLAFAAAAPTAFAGGSTNSPTLGVTFAQFKKQCVDPQDTSVQAAPQNIQIQCTQVSTEYTQDEPGQVALVSQSANNNTVTSALVSNKWFVQSAPMVTSEPQTGTCLRFKEVKKTLSFERALSCNDVVNMADKGDTDNSLNDYCAAQLTNEKGSNPKGVEIVPTGNVIDTCKGVATESAPAPKFE